MKGTNRIYLNQATIVAAVQEYIDKRLTAGAEQQTVLCISTDRSYGGATYVATIEERAK
jgi:hypothetical protein